MAVGQQVKSLNVCVLKGTILPRQQNVRVSKIAFYGFSMISRMYVKA